MTPLSGGQYKRVYREIPPSFRVGRGFNISGDKILLIDEAFDNRAADVIRGAVTENMLRVAVLKGRYVCVLSSVSTTAKALQTLKKKGMVICADHRESLDNIRARVYFDFLSQPESDEASDSILLKISSSEPDRIHANRNRLRSVISRALEPENFFVRSIAGILGPDYSEGEIAKVVRGLPPHILKMSTPESLGRMVGMCIDHSRGGKDRVFVTRQKQLSGAASNIIVEINIVKGDYFGLSHDIASILSVLDLTPLDMRFYYLKGETKKILCRCVAAFNRRIMGNSALSQEIMRLLRDDEVKRSALSTPGERLWFSFVGVFNSIARMLRTIDRDLYPVEDTVEVMKTHHRITREILELFRMNHDPVYVDERLTRRQEKAFVKSIKDRIQRLKASGRTRESFILSFALNFVRSVEKTDYFDFNRLKELFTMVLNFGGIKPFIGGGSFSNPEQLVYIYRRNKPVEILPIYPLEKRVDANRYSETTHIMEIPDPSLPGVLAVRGTLHGFEMRKIAEEVLHEPSALSSRDFKLFEGIKYFDEFDRPHGIQDIRGWSYFPLVTSALFRPVDDDGLQHTEDLYVYDISRRLGLPPDEIQSVEVRFLGEGGLKNVSTVKLFGPSITRTFLVGINRREVQYRSAGHCLSEFNALLENSDKTPLIPKPYGFSVIGEGDDAFGVLYKEYLLGEDAQRHLLGLSNPRRITDLFFQVGFSMGRMFSDLKLGSGDSKLANMIFYHDTIRFCDICPLTDDMGEVMLGFKQLFPEVPTEVIFTLLSGIMSGGGESAAEFLGRIRVNLEADSEDAWNNSVIIKKLDDFALELGISPEDLYSYELK